MGRRWVVTALQRTGQEQKEQKQKEQDQAGPERGAMATFA